MSLIPLGFLGAGGANTFELISTQILPSNGQVSFTNIAQTYKHLQLRWVARDASSTSGGVLVSARVNGATAANYAWHLLNSTGATPVSGNSTSASAIGVGYTTQNGASAGIFGVGVIDILDYTNTTTNKTFRSFSGNVSSYNQLALLSGVYWGATSAITQIDLFTTNGFIAGSRFSLYGVKG